MTVVMLGFMWSMYKGKGIKIAIIAGAALLGVIPSSSTAPRV